MMLPMWHVNHAIGLDFTPVSNRDRAFMVMYTFSMGMLADKFQATTIEMLNY